MDTYESGTHAADRVGAFDKGTSSPVWHRCGWNSRFRHSEQGRSQRPACNTRGVPGQARRDVWYSGPVVAHTHTTTAVHSRKAQHSVKTQIMAPTHADPYGDTPLHCNMAGFCGELDERLYALNSTLAGVYQDVQDKLSDQQHSATLRKSRSSGARVHMNGSLARQVQLLTAAWTTYCDET